MTFADIESTWAQQPAPPATDMTALQRSLKSQLGRRKRMLIYTGVSALIGLIVMQLIFVVGMRSPHAESSWVSFGRLMLHQGISLALLFEIVRAYLRHRLVAKGRTASVRDVVTLSLAGVESEMTDYRIAKWVILVMGGHSLFSVYLNKVTLHLTWGDFGLRVLIIVVLFSLISLLGWRHYRRVLVPRREELKGTLRELEASS